MTDTPGLEWLTVGATVAYIHGGYRSEQVIEATVERIGTRDVFVNVAGRSERFNTRRTRTRGDVQWLYRSGNSQWDRGVELAPLDAPEVASYKAAQEFDSAVYQVRKWSDEFSKARDVDSAQKLRAAVDAFLTLHENEQ
ncbi:hypothetical protein [Nocardia asiatica]|uniref:hypothetical protein n=1 Tax=Nocardia asiatica TaxID=209252 RepID=UPI002458A965|nr:hypothetical protein [Nocardia asiatica]